MKLLELCVGLCGDMVLFEDMNAAILPAVIAPDLSGVSAGVMTSGNRKIDAALWSSLTWRGLPMQNFHYVGFLHQIISRLS